MHQEMDEGGKPYDDDDEQEVTPQYVIYDVLCDYLNPELAFEVAAVMAGSLKDVMIHSPRPEHCTHLAITVSGEGEEPLTWVPSVHSTEAWY